jgi:uncharacterized membrane protein
MPPLDPRYRNAMTDRTRIVVYSGVLAAAYVVLTWAVAPLSYGPIQFRVSEVLKPAALWHPAFALAFGVGNGIANLYSPFGPWDYLAMSAVDAGAALLCYFLRRIPLVGVIVQAIVISAGVAVFPLGFGGGFPFLPTFVSVLVSELVLLVGGYYLLWRKAGPTLFGGDP